MVLELKPKAQRFLSASKAARAGKAARKAKTIARVKDALGKAIENNIPNRALSKKIAIDLKLTQQYVSRIIKNGLFEPKRR